MTPPRTVTSLLESSRATPSPSQRVQLQALLERLWLPPVDERKVAAIAALADVLETRCRAALAVLKAPRRSEHSQRVAAAVEAAIPVHLQTVAEVLAAYPAVVEKVAQVANRGRSAAEDGRRLAKEHVLARGWALPLARSLHLLARWTRLAEAAVNPDARAAHLQAQELRRLLRGRAHTGLSTRRMALGTTLALAAPAAFLTAQLVASAEGASSGPPYWLLPVLAWLLAFSRPVASRLYLAHVRQALGLLEQLGLLAVSASPTPGASVIPFPAAR